MIFSSLWACRSLDRAHAESAFLVAQLSVRGVPSSTSVVNRLLDNPDRQPETKGKLYIMRVPEGQSRPIASTHSKGNTFLFANISPGRYRIYELVIGGPGPLIQDKFGRFRSLNSTIVTWKESVAETSVTEALSGVVGFMGEYTVEIQSRRVSEVIGAKTPAGEERALRRILNGWTGDWPQQVRLQMSGSF